MSEQTILFIHGGGKGAYEADKELALYVKKALGETHPVVYPQMPNEDDTDYETYKNKIEKEVVKIPRDLTHISTVRRKSWFKRNLDYPFDQNSPRKENPVPRAGFYFVSG